MKAMVSYFDEMSKRDARSVYLELRIIKGFKNGRVHCFGCNDDHCGVRFSRGETLHLLSCMSEVEATINDMNAAARGEYFAVDQNHGGIGTSDCVNIAEFCNKLIEHLDKKL